MTNIIFHSVLIFKIAYSSKPELIMIYGSVKYLFGCFFILLLACGQPNTNTELELRGSLYVCSMKCKNSEANEPGRCPVCNMLLVKSIELDSMQQSTTASNQSVYNNDYLWIDQNSDTVRLSRYKGKYQLISMIFTHCDYACPNIIGDMLNIEDDLITNKKALNFLLITIDPDRDTPKQLGDYAEKMDLNVSRWSLLNGDVAAINDVASKLGVSYKKFENGAFGHSNIISLLNKEGEIIYQLEGIHANNEQLVSLINKL